jgi:nucleotide-binding universal stress UspA family protein
MAGIEHIVVGVDGSDSSRTALEWAYDEAAHHGASLVVVTTWQPPSLPLYGSVPPEDYGDQPRREALELLDRFTSALSSPGHPRQLLERAALVLLDYIEDDTEGFRVLTRDAPPVTSGVGTFSSLIGEVARKVEHILADQFTERGYDPQLAELYSQALVGMVALVGQWWLDNRSPGKREVAAHLVNLAYNGLAHLDPHPGLVDGPPDG